MRRSIKSEFSVPFCKTKFPTPGTDIYFIRVEQQIERQKCHKSIEFFFEINFRLSGSITKKLSFVFVAKNSLYFGV
jgi:hypothetical protein